MNQLLRLIPPVHEYQNDSRFKLLMEEHGLDFSSMSTYVKQTVDSIRKQILHEAWEGADPGTSAFLDEFFGLLSKELEIRTCYTIKRVINATGTILHTNLGRARLSEDAVRHVIETARHYCNLEYKLAEGERGSRHAHAETLIKQITGAEAAMVVNNNAAAVFLILRALASDKEVVVSRGQLVEIGGSFRVSSIMEESGAKLVEVGTTNKTRLSDYEKAINENTAMLLKVHTSNFKVVGFTEMVDTNELAALANKHPGIIFYEDLGSGALYDFRKHGIGEEPVVSEVLEMGADIVSFSGDKLLGGPQAGIIAGKKAIIDSLKKHQLARVLRIDKMTLAALEATLVDYLKGEQGMKKIPAIRDLLTSKEELMERAGNFLVRLGKTAAFSAKAVEGMSQVGGGTMPDVLLPSFPIVLKFTDIPAEQAARMMRMDFTPAIVTRIHKDEIYIDLRTVAAHEEDLIIEALHSLSKKGC
ncbi:L-seryl-tRNA(Sec) selenium transferase [Bacillus sp. V3-13]|uniref:L-seryl-tRNA(Sec) selenium transferase n=1 Tax=Bacillus sp. V3-13 TaxID=2053728 RepID=UPI000C7587D9|nr:L-seryl-tRNA(Sec) selenium transferase [Bacillus sp. V3-13]PLR78571.1 L-seryl-tRNA(Sec) selenium transferase [Bacillus sp. V3-13]